MTLDADVVDPRDPAWYQRPDYYDVLASLRRDAPVHRYAPGQYVISRYDDIRAISRDPETFCSGRGVLVNDPLRDGRPRTKAPSILQMDPPEHTAFRQIVSRAFTPRAVRALEPRVRELCGEILDRVPLGVSVDAVEAIAVPLPVVVIAELLGVPQDAWGEFRRWSDAAIQAGDRDDAEVMRPLAELFVFLQEHIDDTRRRGGDHLVARLVDAEVDGRGLTDPELQIFCVSLLVAGNETTRNLVAGGMLALAEHPDELARLLARPDIVAGAVEEMLRWVTPVQAFARTATRTTTMHGVELHEGDYAVMIYASGNRDEAAFGPTADRFDVTRPADPAHVAFGFGQHLCLGASLARLEARVLFEELLTRVDRIAVAGEPRPVRSTIMHGWVQLPLELHPTA